MADLFVSYARRDSDFVRRLQEGLTGRGKDVWVDWEDIPPTADWFAEVQAGIESADAVVFVLTPDSLASEVCARELAHASAHNKRLVPVLHGPVNAAAVPPALAAPNWVRFRDEDDEGPALDTLVAALDTDLDWVRAHTRLLVRAIEWDAAGRDASRLLRGSDLRAGEERIARPPGDPRPTDLQREYVLAGPGRGHPAAAPNLGAVSCALVVAIALGLVALWQRGTGRSPSATPPGRGSSPRSLWRSSPSTPPRASPWPARPSRNGRPPSRRRPLARL